MTITPLPAHAGPGGAVSAGAFSELSRVVASQQAAAAARDSEIFGSHLADPKSVLPSLADPHPHGWLLFFTAKTLLTHCSQHVHGGHSGANTCLCLRAPLACCFLHVPAD
jgi:hypothetical protein